MNKDNKEPSKNPMLVLKFPAKSEDAKNFERFRKSLGEDTPKMRAARMLIRYGIERMENEDQVPTYTSGGILEQKADRQTAILLDMERATNQAKSILPHIYNLLLILVRSAEVSFSIIIKLLIKIYDKGEIDLEKIRQEAEAKADKRAIGAYQSSQKGTGDIVHNYLHGKSYKWVDTDKNAENRAGKIVAEYTNGETVLFNIFEGQNTQTGATYYRPYIIGANGTDYPINKVFGSTAEAMAYVEPLNEKFINFYVD